MAIEYFFVLFSFYPNGCTERGAESRAGQSEQTLRSCSKASGAVRKADPQEMKTLWIIILVSFPSIYPPLSIGVFGSFLL